MSYLRSLLVDNPRINKYSKQLIGLILVLFLLSACGLEFIFPQTTAITTKSPDPVSPTPSPQPSATPTIANTPTATPLPTATEIPFSLYASLLDPLGDDLPYNDQFLEVIQADQDCSNNTPGGAATMLVYDVTGERLLAAVGAEDQMPVASAFKGPLLLYALSEIDPEIWTSVPVMYWSQSGDIPDEFLTLLRENWILSRLYDMIVDSSNKAAADVLAYVNRHSETDLNAIEQFNAWSQEVVGISPDSGMRSWDEGPTAGVVDLNYTHRSVTDWCGRQYGYPNTYSVKDLAIFYAWLLEEAPDQQREVVFELLSIVEGSLNYIESSAISLGGISISKGGIYGGGKSSFVWVDAGLIALEDHMYLVVTSTINAGKRLPAMYAVLRDVIQTETHYDPIGLVNSQTVPDWAVELQEVSKNYLTETHYQANLVAQEIDYIQGADIEDASLMCGPLTGAMLKDVGVIPEDLNLYKFWLGDPPRDGRPWKYFNEEDFYLFAFRSREHALNRFNFRAFPLLPGDVMYTHGGTGTHLFLVIEVDQQGRAFSVNNNCIGDYNCPIQRVMMYDLSNPGVGAFYTDYQEGWFRTGQLGFDLLRSKEYPQIFSDWYFRYALTDWGQ